MADWGVKSACLDPAAYEMHSGNGLDVTVPGGETWYAYNLWWVRIDGAIVFHRTQTPLPLPQGTRITTSEYAPGFAYVCRPSRVTVADNPKMQYQRRLKRLEGLPLHAATKVVTDRQGTSPLEGDNLMIVHVSSHDVAWTILCGPAGCMNTLNEISDTDPIRFAEPVMIPIRTEMFDRIMVSPNTRPHTFVPDVRVGTVLYKRLPPDW